MQLVAVAERTATAELMVPYSPALVPEPLTTRQPDGGEVRDIPLFSTEDGCADTAPKNEAEARTIKRIVVRADMIAIYGTYTFFYLSFGRCSTTLYTLPQAPEAIPCLVDHFLGQKYKT